MPKQTAPSTAKSIDPTRLYSLGEFQRVSGMSTAAVRSARREGLVVRYLGRTAWILGRDFVEFVVSKGRTTR